MDPSLPELPERLLPGEEVETELCVGLGVLVKEESRVDILLSQTTSRVASSLLTIGLAVVVQSVNILASTHGVINLPGYPDQQQYEISVILNVVLLTQC